MTANMINDILGTWVIGKTQFFLIDHRQQVGQDTRILFQALLWSLRIRHYNGSKEATLDPAQIEQEMAQFCDLHPFFSLSVLDRNNCSVLYLPG